MTEVGKVAPKEQQLELEWHQRLSVRIGGLTGSLAAIALAIVTVLAGFYAQQALLGAEREKIQAVGSLVGSSIAAYVAMEESEAATRELRDLSTALPGLVKIEVFDSSGAPFASLQVESATGAGAVITAEAPIAGDLGTVKTSYSREAVDAAATRSWRSLLLVLVVGVLLVLFVAALIGERVARHLRQMAQVAQAVARGELSRSVPAPASRSEVSILAKSFQTMVVNLRELVAELARTVNEIGSVAGESLATTARQQEGAGEQTRVADQTRETLHRLVISGQQIHDVALSVVANAETALSNNQTASERSGHLEGISRRLSDLLDVTRTIAEKSEVLALNAALEGVRAGEHGAGFALVAGEMQRLSESVLAAVKQMSDLTGEMREHTLASTSISLDGITLAEEATRSARKIGDLVGGQQAGMERVEQEMGHVSNTALSLAAGSTQIGEAMNSLVQLAGRLQKQVELFKIESADASAREF